ncbi:MAG: hypothetical protein AB7P76_05375 [Candidatus Melainabacteria bacterium]
MSLPTINPSLPAFGRRPGARTAAALLSISPMLVGAPTGASTPTPAPQATADVFQRQSTSAASGYNDIDCNANTPFNQYGWTTHQFAYRLPTDQQRNYPNITMAQICDVIQDAETTLNAVDPKYKIDGKINWDELNAYGVALYLQKIGSIFAGNPDISYRGPWAAFWPRSFDAREDALQIAGYLATVHKHHPSDPGYFTYFEEWSRRDGEPATLSKQDLLDPNLLQPPGSICDPDQFKSLLEDRDPVFKCQ